VFRGAYRRLHGQGGLRGETVHGRFVSAAVASEEW
jgi:hypothetical protein